MWNWKGAIFGTPLLPPALWPPSKLPLSCFYKKKICSGQTHLMLVLRGVFVPDLQGNVFRTKLCSCLNFSMCLLSTCLPLADYRPRHLELRALRFYSGSLRILNRQYSLDHGRIESRAFWTEATKSQKMVGKSFMNGGGLKQGGIVVGEVGGGAFTGPPSVPFTEAGEMFLCVSISVHFPCCISPRSSSKRSGIIVGIECICGTHHR